MRRGCVRKHASKVDHLNFSLTVIETKGDDDSQVANIFQLSSLSRSAAKERDINEGKQDLLWITATK